MPATLTFNLTDRDQTSHTEEQRSAHSATRPGRESLELLIRHPGPTAEGLLALHGALAGADFLSRPIDAGGASGSALENAFLQWGKRAFDFVFAAFALVACSILLLLCAAAIRAESRGPVLFRQRRIGKGGKPFAIVKFRTMVPDAEAVLQRVLESDPQARAEWERDRKLRKDPRVTRLGRFLRKSSLDELPQFWNVLVGDMSVVGPRPIVNSEIPFYRQAYREYCSVRPGITGLWQVSGRNDTGYKQRVDLDAKYVTSWSPFMDLKILIQTFKTVINAAGAY